MLAALERERRRRQQRLSPAATSRPSTSSTVRPLRGGLRNSNPSARRLPRQQRDLAAAASRAPSRAAPICVSFACACFAFVFLYAEALDEALEPRDVDARPGRPSSWPRAARAGLLAPPVVPRAGEVRRAAGFELEHGGRRPPRGTSGRARRGSRRRRVDCSSRSSHSRLSTSRWFVGSSSSSRSGSPPSARASEARVSSPPENVASGRSRSLVARSRGRAATASTRSRQA